MIISKAKAASFDFDGLVRDYIQDGKLDKVIFILPTIRAVRELKIRFTKQSANKSLGTAYFETFESFAKKLLAEKGTHYNELTDSLESVFLRLTVKESKTDLLKHYGEDIPVGIQRNILAAFSSWKNENVGIEQLKMQANSMTSEFDRDNQLQIITLYELYTKKLKLNNYYGDADIIKDLLNNNADLKKNIESYFGNIDFILIDGFSEFSSTEIQFLSLLADSEPSAVFIRLDYYKFNREIFGSINDKCLGKLTTQGFVEIPASEAPVETKFQKHLKENLFRQIKNEKLNPEIEITHLLGRTINDEVRLIASECKRLCIEESVKPSDICILINSIDTYSPFIRNVFSQFNLPLNLTDRICLSSVLPVIDIISYLEILSEDFHFAKIFRTFSAGILPLYECNISDLKFTASKFNIVRGENEWINLKSSISNSQALSNIHSREKDMIIRGIKAIDIIRKNLSPFRKEMSPSEFLLNFKKLINSFNLLENGIDFNSGSDSNLINSITQLISTTEQVIELLEIEFGTDYKKRLDFYLKNLIQALRFERYTEREPSRFGITVTTPNEARGLKFKYVFLSGLYDRNFPTKYSSELFSFEDSLKLEKRHILEQQYLFYQSLQTWSSKLYVSYPEKQDTEEFMKSRFLIALGRCVNITERNQKEYENYIFSVEDAYKMLADSNYYNWQKNSVDKTINFSFSDLEQHIDIDKSRINQEEGLEAFSGVLDISLLSDKAKASLSTANKKYSVTQFENFASCPFKYFLERILNLQETLEPEEEADSKTFGLILHKIFEDFMVFCHESKIVLSSCSASKSKIAETKLFSIAEELIESNEFAQSLSFWDKERILGVEGDKSKSLLSMFLEFEKNNTAFIPKFFELEFGEFSSSKFLNKMAYPELSIDDIHLRGKIDRIDVDEKNKTFKIIDYKTGAVPKTLHVDEGTYLQLPVYSEAAKKILEKEFGSAFSPVFPDIFSLQGKQDDFGLKIVKQKDSGKIKSVEYNDSSVDVFVEGAQSLIEHSISKIKEFSQRINNGEFPVNPNKSKNPCRYCNYFAVCRQSEIN